MKQTASLGLPSNLRVRQSHLTSFTGPIYPPSRAMPSSPLGHMEAAWPIACGMLEDRTTSQSEWSLGADGGPPVSSKQGAGRGWRLWPGQAWENPASHPSCDSHGRAEFWWLPLQQDWTQRELCMGPRPLENWKGGWAALSPRDPLPAESQPLLPPFLHIHPL